MHRRAMSSPHLLLVAIFSVFSVVCTIPTLSKTVKVWSSCSAANYTPGSAYESNLLSMIKNVVTEAGSYGGYANETAGGEGGAGEDQVFGLAVCFADASPDVCRACLAMAAGNATRLYCPRAAGAAVIYNYCLLRYAAGESFFGRPDMMGRFSFCNNMTRSDEVDRSSGALGLLMERLATAAAASLRLFAFGRANLTANQSLYGLAQCVPDLSPADCRGCLRHLAASLPIWTIGGRAYSQTCYTRFEEVPFYMPPNTPTIVVVEAGLPPHSGDSSLPAATVESRDAKLRGFRIRLSLTVSIIAIIFIVACLTVVKIHKKGYFQSVTWTNSNPKENIEELLEKYGSLAPKRYKHSQLKEITRSFSDKLGEGGYGTVYKGTLPDGHLIAVKFLHDFTRNGEEFINEVISIGRTSHVNVVTLLGFCLEGSKQALIYEYMPNGSLDKFIYAENSQATLGWDRLYEIAVGIARGLEYLHRGCNTRIIHFDIKPHNILLDHDFVPKIADFGLAKLCNPKESYLSMAGMRGTIGFIAPEVFSRRFGVVSTKSDVYSYGMMLLEMVGGRKNLKSNVEKQSEVYFPDWVYSHLAQEGSLQLFDVRGEIEEIARKMASIGLWCIQVSPVSRPTMSKVLEMFENNVHELEIPPKQCFYSAIEEDSSEQQD